MDLPKQLKSDFHLQVNKIPLHSLIYIFKSDEYLANTVYKRRMGLRRCVMAFKLPEKLDF